MSKQDNSCSFPVFPVQLPFGGRFFISYSLLEHGDMRISGGEVAKANRDTFLGATFERLKETRLVSTIARVKHSTEVAVIPSNGLFYHPEVDALVAIRNSHSHLVGVMHADCFPIALADIEAGVSAVIHGGYKPVAGGIISKTIRYMEDQGAERSHICVYIGPGIHHYQFRQFDAFFHFGIHHQKRFLPDENGADYVQLDLRGIIEDILVEEEGISEENVIPSPICTHCDTRFFSARRDRTANRQGMFLVGLI